VPSTVPSSLQGTQVETQARPLHGRLQLSSTQSVPIITIIFLQAAISFFWVAKATLHVWGGEEPDGARQLKQEVSHCAYLLLWSSHAGRLALVVLR